MSVHICKNNILISVRAFGIIGGGAVLAGVGTLGALSSTLLGVGAIGWWFVHNLDF